MNIQRNARLTPLRREEMALSVIEGRLCKAQAARTYGISAKIAARWVERFKTEERAGMADRSSRPRVMPGMTDAAIAERIVALRRQRWTGRHIALAHRVAQPQARMPRKYDLHPIGPGDWLAFKWWQPSSLLTWPGDVPRRQIGRRSSGYVVDWLDRGAHQSRHRHSPGVRSRTWACRLTGCHRRRTVGPIPAIQGSQGRAARPRIGGGVFCEHSALEVPVKRFLERRRMDVVRDTLLLRRTSPGITPQASSTVWPWRKVSSIIPLGPAGRYCAACDSRIDSNPVR